MKANVLMVAYHFPPFRGSSGIQRTLRFVQHLPECGWDPVVLAPHERAYETCSADLLSEVPATVPVERAFALDAARHLSVRGAYPMWLALPDRYSAWLLGAIPAGLRLIRRYRPKAIWTTYPVATAQLIGYALHKLSGIPWIADLRDPMLYEAWPEEPLVRRAHGWVERLVAAHAAKVVCVTPGAMELYESRYGANHAGKFVLIPNGYDEASFAGVTRSANDRSRPMTLVHSGQLEPPDRDPTAFFRALRSLKESGLLSADVLHVVLRGSGFDARYRAQIEDLGVADLVSLEPNVPYRQALQEMVDADGLLLFQGPTCNRQIPAKAYEYIRAGTPIFAICDGDGDTAKLLGQIPQCAAAAFGDERRIAAALAVFLGQLREAPARNPAMDIASRYERKAGARALAALFEEVAGLGALPAHA